MATGDTVSTRDKGQAAESHAETYLRQQGLKTLEKNYRCSWGEVDLIMRHKDAIVFVEVRNRKNQRYGSPAETVTPAKQKKLTRTAQFYCTSQRLSSNQVLRFDIVGITDGSEPAVQWLPNAFYATE